MIPNRGLAGSRNPSNFHPVSIFIIRKNSANKEVFKIESRQRTYVNAETRYPQPINPRIPHQLVISEPLFSDCPDLNLKIRNTNIAMANILRPVIVKNLFSLSG